MAFTTTTKNTAVNALTALGSYLSVHSGDPGVNGANEIAGTARQSTTWGAASNGVSNGSQVTFSAAPAGNYSYYGVWTAVTAGTFLWGFALSPGVTLSDIGTVLVTPHLTFP